MFGNGRETIGVFVTQAFSEYQDMICRGICSRAYSLGYNVAIFSNFLGYGEFEYEYGESNIAFLPMYEDLDGIILLPDTMHVKDFKAKIIDNIKSYAKCPVVSVRQSMEDYYNVLIDDDTVLEEIILHFIKVHKFKKMNFLTGPKDNPASIQRLNTYRRILSENGIPVEEERIYYGDFWKNSAAHAVEKWLSNPDTWPEAIICANDYMAISVCNALLERGILVPRDIAVSGCDNINITMDYIPHITTVGIPVFEMGEEAVDKIHKANRQIPQEKNSFLKYVTYIRESCGCKMHDDLGKALRRNNIIAELEAKDKDIANNAYMSIDLTGVTTLDLLNNKLSSYTYLNKGFSSFYMCLFNDWDSFSRAADFRKIFGDSLVTMEVGIKNGECLQKVQFNGRDLLPPVYMDKEPQYFYFNMLHHQEKCYGYTAINFNNFRAYELSYQGWLTNISNALENIKIHNELNRLVYKLEEMSVKDDLTGLYNRRALHTIGQKYLEQCINNKSNLMVFSADMDNLKYINDNFGHAKGDIAIKIVADALLNASDDDELCIRMGGDEYTVIGIEYDSEKAEKFVSKFENAIRDFNKNNAYNFRISISYGWIIIPASENTRLEECLIIADEKMYKQKYAKEAMV